MTDEEYSRRRALTDAVLGIERTLQARRPGSVAVEPLEVATARLLLALARYLLLD